ncbi:hypothetical protein WR25_06574 [Diploscapter pachys]|uniref:Ion transport domain-containing protein n=1 Tax=Diploscapter pachys TaxID=2018661 RepID=A0A2A2L0P5_9BILA|nr:hypothetical protein WR25_06574 [Diploscapter pachys]
MSITKKNRVNPTKDKPAVIQIDEDNKAVANHGESFMIRKRMKSSRSNTSNHYLSEPESPMTPGASEELGENRNASSQPGILVATQRSISWKKKIREFYSAPITTYWLWFGAFILFLCANTYDLLVKTPKFPSWTEWYVFTYIVVWSIEIIRKVVCLIMIDRKKPALRKAQVFFFGYRNGTLSFALITYIIGFLIRLHPSTKMLGRVILIVNSVLWSLKLIDYLSVQPRLGPYINMAGEMIPGMIPIIVMVFVTLYGFGLVRQSITFPYEDWNWLLLRNIFFQPYFMLYGEVYAEKIDTCGDEIWNTHESENIPISQLNITEETCVPGYFISPLFMTAFMLITNVLLMNTMVACCTYVFDRSIKITQEIFLFERYRHVMEYESTPCLPPPFTIIYHVYWVFKWLRIRNKFFRRQNLLDASLSMTVAAFGAAESLLQQEVKDLEMRLRYIEGKHKEEIDYMKQMNSKLEIMLRIMSTGVGNVNSDNNNSGQPHSGDEGGSSVPLINIPQFTIQPPTAAQSRRSSGQYIKRNSLPRNERKRNSLENKQLTPSEIQRLEKTLQTVDSRGSAGPSQESRKNRPASSPLTTSSAHPATPTFAFDLLESSEYPHHEGDSHDHASDEERDELEPLPMSRNKPIRRSRKHAMYTTIADNIVDDDHPYYAVEPCTSHDSAANFPSSGVDIEYHGESD